MGTLQAKLLVRNDKGDYSGYGQQSQEASMSPALSDETSSDEEQLPEGDEQFESYDVACAAAALASGRKAAGDAAGAERADHANHQLAGIGRYAAAWACIDRQRDTSSAAPRITGTRW